MVKHGFIVSATLVPLPEYDTSRPTPISIVLQSLTANISVFMSLVCVCVFVPVGGRVEGTASGISLSELLLGLVASSSPPCWTDSKEKG